MVSSYTWMFPPSDRQYESDSIDAARRAMGFAKQRRAEQYWPEVVLNVRSNESYGQFMSRVQIEMINNGTYQSVTSLPAPHEWGIAMANLKKMESSVLSKADQMFQEEMKTRGALAETKAKLKLADDLTAVVSAMPNGAVVRFTKAFEGRDIDYGYVAMRAGGRWYLSHDSMNKTQHPSYNDTEFVTWLVTGKSTTELIRMQDAPASAEISGELTDTPWEKDAADRKRWLDGASVKTGADYLATDAHEGAQPER